MSHFEPPINWSDHEDIALKLYERFGDDFTEGKIYRLRFTDLLEWILQIQCNVFVVAPVYRWFKMTHKLLLLISCVIVRSA